MVRGAAINVTPLTIFGVFSVTLFLSEVCAYRQVCTDPNSLCYNSFTGQGQLLWVRVACGTVFWTTVELGVHGVH
jgi:hypothetical protein